MLKSQTPMKTDIGAFYKFPPKDKSIITATLSPEPKELVFDIDLTDYKDFIRDLGNYSTERATERCDRHWAYMETTVHVSKEINHQLKAPLCVCARSGRFEEVQPRNGRAGNGETHRRNRSGWQRERAGKDTKKMDAALNIFRELVENLKKDAKEEL